ncbi:hypothetical protein ABPG75_000481 [Micractinium tetrahymenae]
MGVDHRSLHSIGGDLVGAHLQGGEGGERSDEWGSPRHAASAWAAREAGKSACLRSSAGRRSPGQAECFRCTAVHMAWRVRGRPCHATSPTATAAAGSSRAALLSPRAAPSWPCCPAGQGTPTEQGDKSA